MNSKGIRLFRLAAVVPAVMLFAGSLLNASSHGQGRPIPDGPGKEETRKICSACHDLDKSLSLRQDRDGWQKTLEKMLAYGAQATEQEKNAVLDYLSKNFPADELPKININKASAIDLESGLSLRRSQAAAIIEYRGKNGSFKSIEDLKKVPGIDFAKIEAKKDRIVFE